jgi:hypothetical protein
VVDRELQTKVDNTVGATANAADKKKAISALASTAETNAALSIRAVGFTGVPPRDATLCNIGDLAKRGAEFGSPLNADPTVTTFLPADVDPAAQVAVAFPLDEDAAHPLRSQGIFCRDKTCFLRGRGIDSEMVEASNHASTMRGQPYMLSRNLGDEVAFALLEDELVKMGLFDWTPDGILLSKLDNVPEDALEDQRIDARDGMLYNLSIQGPCIASNWCGKTEMTVMPTDKVFIVIVADCWYKNDNGGDAQLYLDKDAAASLELYKQDKKTKMNATEIVKGQPTETNYDTDAELERVSDATMEQRTLTNFRLRLTTSSEMIQDSGLVFDQSTNKPTRRSRLGLGISTDVTEYVIGGWCIGTIMDSAASRAVGNLGANIGVRTAPNTAAHSLYVNISWYSGDRLYRNYADVEGLTRSRHDPPKVTTDAAEIAVPSTIKIGATEQYKLGPVKKVNMVREGFYEATLGKNAAAKAAGRAEAAMQAQGRVLMKA